MQRAALENEKKSSLAWRALKYAALPGLFPLMRGLFARGHTHIAFLLAQIFNMVRLLPAGHPYLNYANAERYTVLNVVGEAYRRLVFKKENADQIIMFAVVLAGMVIFVMQIFLLMSSILVSAAQAAPISIRDMFTTQEYPTDLAFIMLDRVFGVPGIYNSSGLEGGPTNFHLAFHKLLGFYSTGLLVVATIIFLYFVLAVVAETAQSGTPFGKRFNHVWAPIRLVLAFGLLFPMGSGLNSAQYLTLYIAKLGSGFATNGWVQFYTDIGGQYIFDPETLMASPNPPTTINIVRFFLIAQTCREAYQRINATPVNIDAYVVRGGDASSGTGAMPLSGVSYDLAKQYSGGNIFIRFGELSSSNSGNVGLVDTKCGEMTMPVTTANAADTTSRLLAGPDKIHEAYFNIVKDLWQDASLRQYAAAYVTRVNPRCRPDDGAPLCERGVTLPMPPAYIQGKAIDYYSRALLAMDAVVTMMTNVDHWLLTQTIKEKGWAGAAIWYNKIAELNGPIISAAFAFPFGRAYPDIMAETEALNRKENDALSPLDAYNVNNKLNHEREHAAALRDVYKYLLVSAPAIAAGPATGEPIEDSGTLVGIINWFLGTGGLVDLRAGRNQHLHPLAQLTAIGKSMLEASVRNMAMGFAGVAVGTGLEAMTQNAKAGALKRLGSLGGKIGGGLGGIALAVGTITLTIGFMLFYLLPFLPFMYFFFAFTTWVKSIFEALLGVPLWALAHLRIDGNGLPGDAAMGGYFLLFEIFLRPILTVFGLLAGIMIFAAQVKVFHSMFELAVNNMVGHKPTADWEGTLGSVTTGSLGAAASGGPSTWGSVVETVRGPVDQLFFTIIYAIMVYLMAIASFKLINQIPNNILRWMGASVTSFGDNSGDQAEGLMRNVAVAGSGMMSQMSGGISKIADNIKQDTRAGPPPAVTGIP